ncbi:MAG: peptidoglycan DD-metalloendopeptidase family protein, partial [Vicinamibacteria bacterium]
IHISKRTAVLAASFLGLVVLVAGVLSFHYWRFYGEMRELRRLRMVNAELQRQNLDYEVSVEHLNNRVTSLQEFVKKLSVMAGLDAGHPAEADGGMGGFRDEDPTSLPSAYDEVRDSLHQMAGDLTALEEKGQVLERFYQEHSLMLASTPSIWPVRGYLSSSYGQRNDPFTGEREFHFGIDVSTPIGRPVVAPADGVVLYASKRGSYGNVIVMDHKFGMMTRYAHLSEFNVRAGTRVKRGDVVGYVGNTGRSNGPHLHYEVWVSDRPTHPLNYILEYNKSFQVAGARQTASAGGP